MSNTDVDLQALRGSLSVREAAERLGVSRRTWQRWEKAGRMPVGALKRWRNQHDTTRD